MKRQNAIARLFIALAGIAYLACLALPAVVYKAHEYTPTCMNGPPERDAQGVWSCGHPLAEPATADSGLDMLERGWLGLLTLNFAWWANILGFAAFVIAVAGGAPRPATTLALSGFVFGLQSFTYDGRPGAGDWHTLPVDHLAIGFYVWEGFFLLLALSQWRAWLPQPKAESA
ncbi:MAG TPA: hypothetical protein VHZ78_07870 [Rhizomicrobium sp.]|jgi:hypothetical protein|nr:hypothetical protein [Rhizomicrobium sp.]